MTRPKPLSIDEVRVVAKSGEAAVEELLRCLHENVREAPRGIWVQRQPLQDVLSALADATARRNRGESLPLYGVPFAVKDNIDVAGVPTTAACPAFAYVPTASSPAVNRLIVAGAVFMGKTNLDQFATGLVGVRSPFGICQNPFDERYIAGGSSSGSGTAVATGSVSFALGTDTAGSGRVPAALTNIVGLKPTKGLISTRGVVPACRSLDCVSIFAATCGDAREVFDICAAYDPKDEFAREPVEQHHWDPRSQTRVGVPGPSQRQFFDDPEAKLIFERAVATATRAGMTVCEIDFSPFKKAADLLYGGPWVAERLHAAGELLDSEPETIEPSVRNILEEARRLTALDAFRGQYRLAELRRQADGQWANMDVLLLPTVPRTWTIDEVLDDPIGINRRLGYYTNFVNLLDLAAVAIPAGFRSNGLPLGVTLLGRAHSDMTLLDVGAHLSAALGRDQ